ncbi:MAG: hypothetical protein Q9226_002969 [Calogaya cf. arnoldii]
MHARTATDNKVSNGDIAGPRRVKVSNGDTAGPRRIYAEARIEDKNQKGLRKQAAKPVADPATEPSKRAKKRRRRYTKIQMAVSTVARAELLGFSTSPFFVSCNDQPTSSFSTKDVKHEDVQSDQESSTDSEDKPGPAKKARTNKPDTVNDIPAVPIVGAVDAAPAIDAVDALEKCKAYEKVIARQSMACIQSQLRIKAQASMIEDSVTKAEMNNICAEMISGTNMALRNLQEYPATLARLRPYSNGQLKTEYGEYQQSGTSIDR